ncbi:MAG: division/cell wall cluster transcriptional repressor MraZ [Oscillospiraceae bacterium]|jgi:MraZ protein|nr:division/cell wall cluster transcriptional repressor MraZ [Oscillospiraceae bacterium]
MLINSSQHAVDAKGRIFFPMRFRDDMWDKIVICRGIGKYLMLFSPEEWKRFTDRFNRLPDSSREKVRRFFFSVAAECSVDQQGRLLLPQNLREFAGLNKNVTVAGMQDHAEIWDSDVWAQAQEQISADEISGLMDTLPLA